MACFLEGLGTSKMEPERWQGYDSHTLDLLFSGLISRREFAAHFFKTFYTFRHFGVPFGRPFGSFGSKMEVRKEARKKGRNKSREELQVKGSWTCFFQA